MTDAPEEKNKEAIAQLCILIAKKELGELRDDVEFIPVAEHERLMAEKEAEIECVESWKDLAESQRDELRSQLAEKDSKIEQLLAELKIQDEANDILSRRLAEIDSSARADV